jgi:hypothetical protein
MAQRAVSTLHLYMRRIIVRLFLALSAIAYLGLGARFLLFPEGGAVNLGLTVIDASGLNSIRSLPGGFQGSIGLLILLLLRRNDPRSHDDALSLVLIVSLGFLAGRSTSLIFDGWPNGFVWFATILEVLGVIGAVVLKVWREQIQPTTL